MKYIVQSGIDVGKKRYEVGASITKEQMGKSFKWLVLQGIVLDESKAMEEEQWVKEVMVLVVAQGVVVE